jgi:endonuclease/exonuclease/phosphatase family metal-dependent hydrolase
MRRDEDDLVVLTQNVWGHVAAWPARRDLLARRIRETHPHVVGLQEIHAPDTSGAGSQAHELAEVLGCYETFFAPGRVVSTGACEGVALLCRCDVKEHAIEALTLDRDDPWEGDSQRIVLCATLDLPVGPVDVLVTHLSLSERARRRTITELLAFATSHQRRSASLGAVLMGDLNAEPGETGIGAIGAGDAPGGPWIDAWTRVNGGSRGGTWPMVLPFRRIDYVFARPASAWSIETCERLPFAGSDHLGLVARLRVVSRTRSAFAAEGERDRSGP